MGDYNVNTLRNIPTNRNTDEFNDMMAEHHFYPMVNKPTRVTDNTASIVDVVAMSSSQCVNRGRACIVVIRDNYSEYYMCVHILCQVTFLCSLQGIINNCPIKQLCTPNVFV